MPLSLFRRFAWVLLCVLVLQGCALLRSAPSTTNAPPPVFPFEPEPPPVYATEGLRIATLNTEFMFDGLDEEGEATFPHKGDPVKARAHRDRIGHILRMIDADVVMLEEVENARAMEMLLTESLGDMGYTVHFVEGQDSFTGQDVGLLSRLPVAEVGRTDERVTPPGRDRSQGVSKNMYARLQLGDLSVTIIGLHFLARPTDPDRKPRREAQAEVIRQLVEQEIASGQSVVVLGDFNDYDGQSLDLGGNQPITDVLQRIKAAGPTDADDLRNVAAEVPQRERFTAHWDRNRNDTVDEGEFSAIDHILLSPALYRHIREVTYVQAHNPVTDTDHFPIVVTLGLSE